MKKTVSYLEILLGSALTAIAFGCIILPQGFLAGGVTGLCKIINSYTSLSLSTLVFVVNTIFFVLGYIFIGREFILKTIIVTFSFPFILEFFQNNNFLISLSTDSLFSSLIAGLLLGIGSGLIVRGEGSSGGFDVIGLILQRYIHIPISFFIGLCDAIVLCIQILDQSFLHAFYGLFIIFFTSISMKYTIAYGKGQIQILIFSQYYETLRKELYHQADVGLTFLKGEMGYTRENTNVIIVISHYNKLNLIKSVIKSIDPTAFVVINNVNSVIGKGYTIPTILS